MIISEKIELLSPAKNAEYGISAINCGADAVYIGASKFGARAAVGNSIEEISKLIKYAHKYRARVYATINTILFDSEIDDAVGIIRQLYNEGIDAVIFQDMALLEADLPPVALHASTQTHNYDPERIRFLDKQNIQRIILARELSVNEISEIRKSVSCELEYFIHGALCVCFSGQCYLSYAIGGRSANRGECAQPCRLNYNLADSEGKIIVENKHLLSLKDLNLSAHLYELMSSGITSFKIEGRLKDIAYVKNITAYYRRKLDEIIENADGIEKSSIGNSEISFEPDPDITFNRGFTNYFFDGRQKDISSMNSPKSKGKLIGRIVKSADNFFIVDGTAELANGDGLYLMKDEKEIGGMYINKFEGRKIFKDKSLLTPTGTEVYRNFDSAFLKVLNRNDEKRRIPAILDINESCNGISVKMIIAGTGNDEDFIIEREFDTGNEIADNPQKMTGIIQKQFSKSGDSVFKIEAVNVMMGKVPFIQVSGLNEIRRRFFDYAEQVLVGSHPLVRRENVQQEEKYFTTELNYRANVVNSLAKKFYSNNGVTKIDGGMELSGEKNGALMTCRYCIKNELNICPADKKTDKIKLNEPLFLENEYGKFQLKFNCSECEMQLFKVDY